MRHHWYLSVLFILAGTGLFAQPGQGGNKFCETAAPFCTGTLYSFPAGVNAGSGQSGPNYGCLLTRPNPAWYYMKVGNPGSIIIEMHSVPGKDIDFCCWGPFYSQNCCDSLTNAKIVDCSYSALSYETVNIPNGQTGQYYMLVITNYSNSPCNIIFQQTGGTGTTDCSILPPACTSNSPICNGQTIQLSAQNVSGATYHWWGPAGFTSQLQNPTITNATPANAGEYFLRVEVSGQTSSDTSTTLVHVYQPQSNAGNDTTIMNGVTTVLHGSCTAGSGSYHYKWSPSALLVNDSVQNPHTVNLFSTTIFSLTVTDDSANCQANDMVTIDIAGGVLAVNALATPPSICKGASSQLQAFGSGGAGNYVYNWTGPNGFTSTLANPSVAPAETSTYHVSASDGYNTVNSSVTVNVIQLPLAYAGEDQEIPNGTYTFLSGSVIGGTSNYYYSWSPAGKLVNAGIQNPQTTYLEETTVYSLTVTDLITNCISDNDAIVTVEVTGGPLNVNPVALPASICRGDSARLYASAGGGNVGHYEYSWTSNPQGFTSNEANPLVYPVVNTSYTVTLYDQFNTRIGSTAVAIYPEPFIRLGPPDTLVCIYDTARLYAGNPGSAYLWSNGSIEQQIEFGTTGIGYDAQEYSVEVTNQQGCKSTGSIVVIFSFDACVGIDDMDISDHIRIYPNPAKNIVSIDLEGVSGITKGTFLTTLGKVLREFTMPESDNLKSSTSLDLTDFPKGIYLIRFRNNAFTNVQKIVLE